MEEVSWERERHTNTGFFVALIKRSTKTCSSEQQLQQQQQQQQQ